MIYADNAATTALSPAALDALVSCLRQEYGNPSSLHMAGRQAAKTLESARECVAGCLCAEPREIYFTSGGTEADNWAVHIAAQFGARKNKRHIISSAFEHHAILHALDRQREMGFEITLLPVHSDGRVRPDELAGAIRGDTALVTIMYANNEIGTLQPIPELARICRERGVLFHTDAAQAAGHVAIDARGIDMLSLSAHKFHGPRGAGALYCRKEIPITPFMEGGAQERGKRAGTENVPAIAGMAAALSESCRAMPENAARVRAMRGRLVAALSAIERGRLNGHPQDRLPGIVNFCFEGVEGEPLLYLLDKEGICASSGSACTSGSLDPSHVLLALGVPHELAHGSLRLSLSGYNTPEEIEYIAAVLPRIIERLRARSNT